MPVFIAVLALSLGLGVVTLCVQTEGSQAFVLVDSNRTFDILYAHVGIVTGIYTTILLALSLVQDSCHRPWTILYELFLLAFPTAAWIVVAVMTAVQDGRNFTDSVCSDPDSTVDDICRYAAPIVGLSAAVAALLALYLLVLLYVATVSARRGKPMWTSSVPRRSVDHNERVTRDVEAQGPVSLRIPSRRRASKKVGGLGFLGSRTQSLHSTITRRHSSCGATVHAVTTHSSHSRVASAHVLAAGN
ncbi:hypothetical protein C8Q77DRAFT_860603 [Trametes polyzona]|nr:hypothetical protein C8Q77DRAFT_860603 [Trametes polyzona]